MPPTKFKTNEPYNAGLAYGFRWASTFRATSSPSLLEKVKAADAQLPQETAVSAKLLGLSPEALEAGTPASKIAIDTFNDGAHDGILAEAAMADQAEKTYPNSKGQRSTFMKGAAAACAGISDIANPYNKPPCTGFLAAHRNAWDAGWSAWYLAHARHV